MSEFSRFCTKITPDGETFILYLELADGSVRAVHWSIADLVAMAGEVAPATHVPEGIALQ